MNLVIDIGNSRTKYAFFEKHTLIDCENESLVIALKNKSVTSTIISSVASSVEVEKILKEKKISFFHLDTSTKLPVNNAYKTPNTLGEDRIANVVAASNLFPNKNVLTIDCGTCIKYDSIDSLGVYRGGGISPGLSMRFKSLHTFTYGLPLVEPKQIDYLIGNSSENSILSGVINGCKMEIDGVIEQYRSIYENLTVIFTGGDASFFDLELKSNIFVESNLTLIGLNEILLYNTSK